MQPEGCTAVVAEGCDEADHTCVHLCGETEELSLHVVTVAEAHSTIESDLEIGVVICKRHYEIAELSIQFASA